MNDWNADSVRANPSEITPSMHVDEFREIVREVLDEELGISDVAMGSRWEGGTLIVKPGDPSAQSKEIPLDGFFHKLVMVRDRLRVLEAKINGNKKLSEGDKVEMQQYVTRIYGSLTTFNILFKDRAFKGDSTK